MKLLILDGPRDPRSAEYRRYRGTYRSHPTYCESCGDSDEINRLFFWYLEEGGELGVVQNLENALRFAGLWNTRMAESERFDVVEVTDGAEPPLNKGRFLGFDLSAGYNNSLISSTMGRSIQNDAVPGEVKDSFELICRQHGPSLNENGLFDRLQPAEACMDSLASLQRKWPNLFEGGSFGLFRATALYIIKGREEPWVI